MKRAIMLITPELISQLLMEGNEIHVKVESELPEDAKLVDVLPGTDMRYVHFVFESEEFEDITEKDATLPTLKPAVFARMECGEKAEEKIDLDALRQLFLQHDCHETWIEGMVDQVFAIFGKDKLRLGLCGCGNEGTQAVGDSVYCEDCI